VKATKVNAGLAESNGRLLLGIWRDSLHVTCGLTAVHRDQLRAQRSVTSIWENFTFYSPTGKSSNIEILIGVVISVVISSQDTQLQE